MRVRSVVVEWFNVSAVEASPEWTYTNRAVLDAGAAWVGVSVQALGVVGGTSIIQTGDPGQASSSGGMKGGNPARYGNLAHPGDAYSFDIYSQIAAALRSPEGHEVLGGSEPRWIVAAGVDGTTVRRDELGLALGGIRTPSVESQSPA